MNKTKRQQCTDHNSLKVWSRIRYCQQHHQWDGYKPGKGFCTVRRGVAYKLAGSDMLRNERIQQARVCKECYDSLHELNTRANERTAGS